MDFIPVNSIKRVAEAAINSPAWNMGAFSLRLHIIRRYPLLVQEIFKKCIPVEVYNSFVTDSIRYIAHSPLFKPTPEGSFITEYEVFFKESLSGVIEITFVEIVEQTVLNGIQRTVTYA